jgi:hypothetical protein
MKISPPFLGGGGYPQEGATPPDRFDWRVRLGREDG